jgi:hypothetical protein
MQNKMKEKIPNNETESVEEERKILKKIQQQETRVEHQGKDTKKCLGKMTEWQK